MYVSNLMQRRVATVRQDERLDRAAHLLRDRECGSVVVVDDRRRPVAMVTDRDICLAALRHATALAEIPVSAAMSAKLFTCRGEQELDEAERTMSLHQVRRLPVVDGDGVLVGLLALDDVAREASRERELLSPRVSCSSVGRTLGDITRPRVVEG